MQAQITTFVDTRGFGFLTDSEGTQYFFHVSNLLRDAGKERKLRLGEMVSFEITDPVKLGGKMQAIKIRVIDAAEPVADVSQIGASKVGV
jgi:cold shock CspA family protein